MKKKAIENMTCDKCGTPIFKGCCYHDKSGQKICDSCEKGVPYDK